MAIQVSHNVTTHIGLDTAVIVQVEFLPKSMGLHGIILIGQVHLHSILPLIHIQNSRWRLKSLLPLCNTATVLQRPLQRANALMQSYTHVLFLPSSYAMSLYFLSVILSQYPSPYFLLGKMHVSTFCCLSALWKWKAENSIGTAKAGRVTDG